ncbi:ATP/GTP-binding protein [Sulfuricurvum sp.]|uniref:AAA family ATPase n=1 Tax=Sulfuricurvum sp. TaxID=2025608 RepID=UPI0035697992
MGEHFLKWINIVDFKCFHNFESKDFQRINLISGKNNVGKTAFMEACFINMRAMNIKNFVGALWGVKYMRENLNILANNTTNNAKIFMERSNGINLISNINKSSFKIEEQDGIKLYNFEFNKQYIRVNTNDFSYEIDIIDNIKFIDSFGLSNGEIIRYYSTIQKKDEETFLNTILNEFDNSIEAFKVIDDLPQCKINETWLEITEFGDGVRHVISIVNALFQAQNGYLFIDELENGIHYTYLDRVWEVILKVSKEQNVQVFATTHSKECIESYARVAKKLEDQEIAYIRMSKLSDGQIKATTFDYELIENSIEQDHEVRGW